MAKAYYCGRQTAAGAKCRRRVRARGAPCKDHRQGRPRLEFDLVQVEKLARIQCTDEEIAAVLGCSKSTVSEHKQSDEAFRTAIERGREIGKRSLRRAMWRHALKGDRTLMIWLSKQHLGMADKAEIEERREVTYTSRPTSPEEARAILQQEGIVN